MSDAIPEVRAPHPFLRLLHLLWAVPLAVVISLGLLFMAAIEECGISGCGGGGIGVATGGRGSVPFFHLGDRRRVVPMFGGRAMAPSGLGSVPDRLGSRNRLGRLLHGGYHVAGIARKEPGIRTPRP